MRGFGGVGGEGEVEDGRVVGVGGRVGDCEEEGWGIGI